MLHLYETDGLNLNINSMVNFNKSQNFENANLSTSTLDNRELLAMDVRDKLTVGSISMFLFELPILMMGQSFCIIFLVILKRTRCFHQV
jgi:hypothetical protein